MRPILVRPDGSLAIIACAPGVDPAQEAARLLTQPDYADCAYVGMHTPPNNRRFRACWRHVAGVVGVDMPLARVQREGELRAERDQKLVAADVLTMKALDGTNLQRQQVAAYKRSLRDATISFSADLALLVTADSLDAYAYAWPVAPSV